MKALQVRVAEVMKLHSGLIGILMQQFTSLLLHRLCLGWMVGARYGDDIELPVLQNLQALEERRNCPFVIQRGRVIVKIVAFLDDFLLFSTPEHGKYDREIHASLLCIDSKQFIIHSYLAIPLALPTRRPLIHIKASHLKAIQANQSWPRRTRHAGFP